MVSCQVKQERAHTKPVCPAKSSSATQNAITKHLAALAPCTLQSTAGCPPPHPAGRLPHRALHHTSSSTRSTFSSVSSRVWSAAAAAHTRLLAPAGSGQHCACWHQAGSGSRPSREARAPTGQQHARVHHSRCCLEIRHPRLLAAAARPLRSCRTCAGLLLRSRVAGPEGRSCRGSCIAQAPAKACMAPAARGGAAAAALRSATRTAVTGLVLPRHRLVQIECRRDVQCKQRATGRGAWPCIGIWAAGEAGGRRGEGHQKMGH